MAHLNIFKNSAFEMAELVEDINKKPHAPSWLGSLGLFEPAPVRTDTISIEEKQGQLALLPTAALGSHGATGTRPTRKIRDFRVPSIPQFRDLMALEIRNIRAYGSESELEAVAEAVSEILGEMRAHHEVTHEWHRIGAIKGQVLDADGSTVIYNYFTEFDGITETDITFNMAEGAADLQLLCHQVIRSMNSALGMTPFSGVLAVVGDRAFDALINHASTQAGFLRWNDSEFFRTSKLGAMFSGGQANGFSFGGIDWFNYRGTIGDVQFIGDAVARFVPLGVPGLFKEVMAPADFMETVGTRGKKFYAKQEPLPFNRGIKFHSQSNVLYMPTRPQALIKGSFTNIPAIVPAGEGDPIVVSSVQHLARPGDKVKDVDGVNQVITEDGKVRQEIGNPKSEAKKPE